MSRATTRTLVPLDRWAEILGLDPRHFNQVAVPDQKPLTTCANVWKQHAWQETDQIGREDVANAIRQAEDAIMQEVGYKLLPFWEVDDRVQTRRPANPEVLNRPATDPRGFWLGVKTSYGHFITGGLEAKTLIEAGVAVTYSDPDGDGYLETATITFNTTVTDEEELGVYFPGESGADEWEVRPLRTVSIAAGVATITMWRHQLVDPAQWEALSPEAVNGVSGNFVATVDVYRHFNDPQQQVQLIWSARPSTCDCGSTDCDNCNFSTQFGCLTAKDHRIGLVSYAPGTWSATDEAFANAELSVSRNPDRLRLWYRAGNRDMSRNWPTLQMEPQWERAVVYYSIQFLDRPLCGCSNLEHTAQYWREDLALRIEDRSYQLSDRVLENPLGTSRGAIFTWRIIHGRGRRLGEAVVY